MLACSLAHPSRECLRKTEVAELDVAVIAYEDLYVPQRSSASFFC
jgi:hypothetical protein